jgi:hypothetical protein
MLHMNQPVETVAFHGQELLVVQDEAGQKWAAVRPICAAIGLNLTSQREKIENNAGFSWAVISSTGADNKSYEMFCLPISQLNGWLFSINPNKVKPEIRKNLLVYQQECHNVLYKHFMPQGGTVTEVTGLVRALQTDMVAIRNEMRLGFDSVQAEVDELRELIHVAISDSDEKETRELIRQVKKENGLDGRAVVGHVRKTLGTAGVYNTPNLLQVKNVLRNMLGKGVLGLVGDTPG